MVHEDGMLMSNAKAIADIATRAGFLYRPTELVKLGSLIGYGANILEIWRRGPYSWIGSEGIKPGEPQSSRRGSSNWRSTSRQQKHRHPSAVDLVRADNVVE